MVESIDLCKSYYDISFQDPDLITSANPLEFPIPDTNDYFKSIVKNFEETSNNDTLIKQDSILVDNICSALDS